MNAIAIESTTRTTVISWITSLRPPAMRSIVGPMSGATNRNGTKLIPRNSSTRLRAASASRLNNTESASATAIAASPAAIDAWVRASRPKRDVTVVVRRAGGRVTGPVRPAGAPRPPAGGTGGRVVTSAS